MADNVELVRRLWTAFERGGLDAVLEITDPDVEWEPYGGGGTVYRGHEGLRAYMGERRERGEEVEGIPYERVLPILTAVNDDVGAEIQKTIDFFKQISATDEPLDRLYLTGGGSQVVHLKEALGERLNTQAELLNPFRNIPAAGRDVTPEVVSDLTPVASVAVGLALRKVGD